MLDLKHKIRTRWAVAPNTIVAAENRGTGFQDFVCNFFALEGSEIILYKVAGGCL